MVEALSRAVLLAVLVVLLAWAPLGALALIIVWLAVEALFANRTRAHAVGNQVVLVTGASSGLGRELALEAARRGAGKVLLVARRAEKLEDTAAAVGQANANCVAVCIPCDISDPDAVRSMAAAVIESHGVPNILVNNAGAGAWQHFEEGSADDALRHTSVPYLGAVWVTQAFFGGMKERGTGHVLNVTSAASLVGFRAAVTYGTARWAMLGFSRYLAADAAEVGIGVTLLNAAEITGTAYFDAANAGAESHARIPWLFQLPFVTMFNGTSAQAASAAWSGVQNGTHEVLFPRILLVPTVLLRDLMPQTLNAALGLGRNGKRA